MKSLFKVTLLATTMALTLGSAQVMAEEKATTKAEEKATTAPEAEAKPEAKPEAKAEAKPEAKAEVKPEAKAAEQSSFKSEEAKVSYALGASMGRYMENTIKEQEKLGIKLDSQAMLAGIDEAAAGKSQLSDKEIEATLQVFGEKVKQKVRVKMEAEAKENEAKGDKFREEFTKKENVKTTKSGLAYKIEKEGKGPKPKDSDTVVVNYKGELIDGTEFDSSYKRGEPLTFRLDEIIPGWAEGLKLVNKGSKMTLVIPPALAYGESGVPGSIPPNSTLVFEIELLDIKPEPKAEAKKEEAANEKASKTTELKVKSN